MSSNDELIILKKGKKFQVHHHFCVDNEFHPSKETLLKTKDTLIEAIKFANEICAEWPYVEYGYYVHTSCLK